MADITLGLTVNTYDTGILYPDAVGASSSVNKLFYKEPNNK